MIANPEEPVRVVVRVRPFSQREMKRKCQVIVEMDDPQTILVNPNDPTDRKCFSFDHSYWSFDGYKEDSEGHFIPHFDHPNGEKYCDQNRLFNELGTTLLTNAWDGYNATLLAYGQTGSGKSYSVMGYGPNEGIVPKFCRELFGSLKQRTNGENTQQFEVKVSMLEIYNEIVRDLLDSSKNKKGLKIREHPKRGFYAEGLKNILTTQYEDIVQDMEEGFINRTVASTNANRTSSRAHTIFTITLVQKNRNKVGQETTKTSVVNIVDLAGSERIDSTGLNAERFKEGTAINQSLSCLGNCIHALAESSSGRILKVPYRDSVLTKLLMNALGGNSKTIMIASISPADISYYETLSTLRYADRAKRIRTRATVNEDATDKLIRELKLENERLKLALTHGNSVAERLKVMLRSGKVVDSLETKESRDKWEDDVRAQMLENERQMEEMKRSYEEKLRQVEMSDHVQ